MEREGLANILHISHNISSELKFDKLLKLFVEICLNNTEADRCVIMENQEGKLLIQADGTKNKGIEVMQSIPIEARGRIRRTFVLAQQLPLFAVDTVVKQQQSVLIDDFEEHLDDPYVENFKPQSAFSIPVVFQGHLSAIIYLESFKQTKAFSLYAQEFIEILADQFAISLQNAKDYHKLQRRYNDVEGELFNQKDRNNQFQQNVKLLGEIGQDIAANRKIEEIIDSVYANVNTLMDASLFSIGIYNAEQNTIDMPSTIEKDIKLPPHSYDINEKTRLAVWCLKNAKEVFINDYVSDFHRYFPNTPMPDPKVGEVPDSVIYLPVYVKNEAIGVITVQSFRKYAYSEYHLNILRNLAVYVAIAVENADAYQELENSRKEIAEQKSLIETNSAELATQKEQIANAYQDFKLLAGLGRDITTNLKIEDIVMAAHKALSNLMDTSIFTIGIYDEEDETLSMPLTIEDEQILGAHSYSIKDNEHRMAVWCFNNARDVLITDYINQYNDYFPDVPLAKPKIGELPNSIMYLPIFSKGDVLGVITVQTIQKAAYNEYHLNFIKNLAVYVGIALENAEAYKKIEASKTEIHEQKQLIEQSYENINLLGKIGKDIISNLEVEGIVETVYENVNALMDAPIFSIGMYNPDNQEIEVTGSIENYEKLPFHSYSIDSKASLSVLCFKGVQEINIRDCEKEFNHYLPNVPLPEPDVGDLPESIIYLPLQAKDKTVGVLTVQSFKKFAYDDYHLDILRNLAVYISIALENADALRRIESSKQEIAEQSKLLEQSFNNVKLLKDIGQGITSSLSAEKIIDTVYANVNDLMDASVFWIGTYNKKENVLEFNGAKEKGNTLADFQISIDNKAKLATWCFDHQKEVFINDVEVDYVNYLENRSTPVVGEFAESIIYIPLTVKGEKLGVLTVQSFKKNAYTSYHLDILQNLATYIFIALENAKLYQNMEDQVRERTAEVEAQRDQINQSFENIKLLSDIGQDITGTLSIDTIVAKVYDNVNNLMDATTFGIGVIDREAGKIVFRGAIEKGKNLPEFYHPINDQLRFSVWAIENNESVFINDFREEYQKYIPQMKPAAAGADADSILYVPLNTQNGCIGVITIQSFEKNAYTQYHLDLLKNLAVYIGIALENAEAYREIESFSHRIESTNQKLTSSINYAKRIQDAILPQNETIKRHLPESFVFYQPRDIVSGDFYWIYESYGKVFIAAIDCTGHGVPGAFMSMVGNDLLNEVVVNIGYEEPDYILSELHMGIRNALRQDKSDNRDGMDVALCIIDKKANRLDYAGAKRPLVLVKNNELQVIKPTRLSVGGFQQKTYRSYKKHSISTAGVDAFYIYSDGYQDQFGGDSKRKFRSRNFKDLLLKIHKEPMEKQKEILQDTLKKWMGESKQIDDILVMGFKV